ncbi:hypothetical protein BDP27DRAFT_1344531 [Rhodocollybia butyracea]|uniref:Uncharacterized protein n=1 Tax=Rhodocollybia butyracea TaxID=206335 RepID=A0A9P5P8G7_9AGAR|nr:hypothetical protein BDP27DRAFT_1344531 [Rhodocollybia butyracea]
MCCAFKWEVASMLVWAVLLWSEGEASSCVGQSRPCIIDTFLSHGGVGLKVEDGFYSQYVANKDGREGRALQ